MHTYTTAQTPYSQICIVTHCFHCEPHIHDVVLSSAVFDFMHPFTPGFPCRSFGKESVCNAGDPGSIPGSGRPLWRRKWQASPVFLPGKSHGQRSLTGHNPWHHKRVGQDLATKQLNNEVIFPS